MRYRHLVTAARLLASARHTRGLSQRELSRRSGVPQPLICAYETGRRQPGADMLARLLRAAGYELELADTVAASRPAAKKLEQVVALAAALPARRKPPVRTWAELTR